MSSTFINKRVVIAGGSSGIGLATAKLFKAENAQVTITGRDKEKLEKLKDAEGFDTHVVDSNSREALEGFFTGIGKIDHLVIALSGGKGAGNFAELSLSDLRDGFDGKFWPQLHTLQAALPHIDKNGSITVITAISSKALLPGTSGLAAINGALELMVPVIAKEIKPLRINAVSPGVVDTPWWNFLPESSRQETFKHYGTQIPVGRVAQPEEIADAILFLAGNSYVTGSIVACDGGLGL